jgi:hypothetical protein
MLKRWMKNGILCTALIAMLVQVTSCGTIMYPERKGQAAGRIDAQVAILDGIGLLFFLVPGVIAFAVDFSNGTIYLPGGSSMTPATSDLDGMVALNVGEDRLTEERIEAIIAHETGRTVDLSDGRVVAHRVDPSSSLR